MKKLKIIRRIIFIVAILCLIIIGSYTYFISPSDYGFENYNFVHKNIPSELNGFKIAYISDINLNDKNDLERLQKAIEELNEQPFDMIIFGGDLYDSKVFSTKEVSSALKSISCKYGKFAVLGDKDESASMEVTEVLNNGGFEVIDNEARTLYYKDASFTMIGCQKDTDISDFKINTKTITLLVTHQPDSFTQYQGKIDLQLSGHSYGGSLYIPFYGPLFPMEDAKTYNHSIYEESGSTLLVSNGFSGPSSLPYKLFARNQINFITLKTSSTSE